MQISREKLAEIARTFLQLLEKERVSLTQDLEKLTGQTIPVEGKEHEYVSTSWRPSNFGTKALSVEYIIQHEPGKIGRGTPLNVRINPTQSYSQIFLKCSEKIPGYDPFNPPFIFDPFGNLRQAKRLDTLDWRLVQEEVRKLSVA